MQDLANNLKAVNGLVPAVIGSADVNGLTVDLKGYGSALFVVQSGVEGDALSGSVKFDFYLEESADDSTWTAVADADAIRPAQSANVLTLVSGLFLTLDADAETPQIAVIGYRGSKRYARLRIDKTGTHTNGTPMSIAAILGHPHLAPVA